MKVAPRRWMVVVVGLGLMGFGGFLAFEVAVRRVELPSEKLRESLATTVVLDRAGRELAVLPTEQARDARPVGLDEMGPWLPSVSVAIEDHRFYRHSGVDAIATSGAALRNMRQGRVIGGASTITQQLVKLATGRKGRTFTEKVGEVLTAVRLEREWGKNEILAAYLNRLDYGNRRVGPEAAARAYFGKSATELGLAESIFLAGLPQAPGRLNPWSAPEAAEVRYRQNVARLAKLGVLPGWVNAETLSPPRVLRHDPPSRAPHFVQGVVRRGGWQGARVVTTLDLNMQSAIEQMLRHHLAATGSMGIGDMGAVVVHTASGEIRALASGGLRAAMNAALVPRSAGSTLKPFVYAEALERRVLTAATLLPDTPDAITAVYADYDPRNYSRRSYGPVRVREALGNSMNVPAVLTVSRLGARSAFASLAKWGLHPQGGFDTTGAGFVLGNAAVTAVDLAAAYASLARGGQAWPAKWLPSELPQVRVAASPETCFIITDILCDNHARLLSFGENSPLALPFRAAAKTGTSSAFRDGWCAGFTGSHTVVVWAGSLDGRSMEELLAVRSAAPLWAAIVGWLHTMGDPEVPPTRTRRGLVSVKVARETGLLPRAGEAILTEWFLAGTEPQENAETHYDAEGRLLLPPEYAAWCAGPQNHLRARVRLTAPRILFPRQGASFTLTPGVSRTRQAISASSQPPTTNWTLNGENVDATTIPLVPGRHTLTAETQDGSSSVTFTVD